MGFHHRTFVAVLTAVLAVAVAGSLCAQDEPAKNPPRTAAATAGDDDDVQVPQRPDPAVEAILASTDPTKPAELTRAAKILADLQRPDLAKNYLKKVLDARLNQKQLAGLVAQFGSALFVSLSERVDLQPMGKQLADAALGAAEQESRDPQRLAALVKQLQAPSSDDRFAAAEAIREARGAAVGTLLGVWADPNREAEHANVMAVLVRLGPDAIRPLIGALESPDRRIVAGAVQALSAMEAKASIESLLAPCTSEKSDPAVRKLAAAALAKLVGQTPTPPEAARLLIERAGEYFNRHRTVHEDLDGQMEIWTWDEAQKAPVGHHYPADEARRMLAARYAREAHAILPEDAAAQVLYLATLLELAAYDNGLDKPLPDDAGSPAAVAGGFPPSVLESVLALALKDGHPAAAAAAARILGSKGTAEDLLYRSAMPGPLVEATRNADRRLRLAAAEAILRLKPSHPFAASNQVTEVLGFLVNTSGKPRAIVADPSAEEANRVGGYLTAMGYQVDVATNGRDVIRLAIDCPDYELVLLAASLDKPTVDFVLQQLRHDCRSALLPVGVLARDGQQQRAHHLVRNDPLAEAFVRPHRQQDVQWMVEQLLGRAGPSAVPPEARQEEASQALALLLEISAAPSTLFDVHRYEPALISAQKIPALAREGAIALGKLGTARSQKTLVDQASRWTLPLLVRKAALVALQSSIEKYGVLLTTEEIKQQYDRYNQSSDRDADTQQVLGLILDAIEAPSKRLREAAATTKSSLVPPPPAAAAKPAGK